MVVLNELSGERLRSMLAAGQDILECYRVLERGGLNIVGEVLKGGGTFYEWNHYPDGDVFDPDSHSQHYYHAHRAEEHGHFHTFLCQLGMPKGTRPIKNKGKEKWPRGKDILSHLIGISMDAYGFPIRLFTTNRWVTGEAWYQADDVIAMLDLFVIDHANPSWPVNRWISGMIRLFQPQIADLIIERDATIERWREQHPGGDVFEDRELDATSLLDISVQDQVAAVEQALAAV